MLMYICSIHYTLTAGIDKAQDGENQENFREPWRIFLQLIDGGGRGLYNKAINNTG